MPAQTASDLFTKLHSYATGTYKAATGSYKRGLGSIVRGFLVNHFMGSLDADDRLEKARRRIYIVEGDLAAKRAAAMEEAIQQWTQQFKEYRDVNGTAAVRGVFKKLVTVTYQSVFSGSEIADANTKAAVLLSIKKYLMERIIGDDMEYLVNGELVIDSFYAAYKEHRDDERLKALLEHIQSTHTLIMSDVRVLGMHKKALLEDIEIYLRSRVDWELKNPGKEFYKPYVDPQTAFFAVVEAELLVHVNGKRSAASRRASKQPLNAELQQQGQETPNLRLQEARRNTSFNQLVSSPQNSIPDEEEEKSVKQKPSAPPSSSITDRVTISLKAQASLPVMPTYSNMIHLRILNPLYLVDALGQLILFNGAKGICMATHASVDLCFGEGEMRHSSWKDWIKGLIIGFFAVPLMLLNACTFALGKLGSFTAWKSLAEGGYNKLCSTSNKLLILVPLTEEEGPPRNSLPASQKKVTRQSSGGKYFSTQAVIRVTRGTLAEPGAEVESVLGEERDHCEEGKFYHGTQVLTFNYSPPLRKDERSLNLPTDEALNLDLSSVPNTPIYIPY